MLKAWLAVRNCLQAYWGRARSFFFALLPTIYLLSHKFRLYSSNYEDRITTTILQLFAICYISNNQRTAKLLHSYFSGCIQRLRNYHEQQKLTKSKLLKYKYFQNLTLQRLFLVASEIPYKFATYFYRREFTRLYFCHIVNIVDNGLRQVTRVDIFLSCFCVKQYRGES